MLPRQAVARLCRAARPIALPQLPQRAVRASFSTTRAIRAGGTPEMAAPEITNPAVDDPGMVRVSEQELRGMVLTCVEWWLHQPSRYQETVQRSLCGLDRQARTKEFRRAGSRGRGHLGNLLARGVHTHDADAGFGAVDPLLDMCGRIELHSLSYIS